MIKDLLIALIALALIAAAAIFVANYQIKRAKRIEADALVLREAFKRLQEGAARLQKTNDKTAQAEGEANAERKELAEILDSDLVSRANDLFKRL